MEVDGDVKHLKTGRLKKSAKCIIFTLNFKSLT